MNEEVKRRWVEALRSRRYVQGQGKLCYKDRKGVERFCCLGVLCDVLNVPYKEARNSAGEIRRLYGADERIFLLPDEATSVAEIDEEVFVPREAVEHLLVEYNLGYLTKDLISLTTLNDHPIPFEKIADIIEKAL